MIDFLARAFGDKSRESAPQSPKRINLALQGGGAHGAFTWGVLDHLLEDGRLAVDGISGTSAGAVNAVMLADGLSRGAVGADRLILGASGLCRSSWVLTAPPPFSNRL